MRDRINDVRATPALQVANVEDTPGATVGVGDQENSNAFFYDDFQDVQTDLTGNQLVRFGFNVTSATASTLAMARVAARVEVRDF